MKQLKSVKKTIGISINVLTKLWGIDADLFFPKSFLDLEHGKRDDNIEYNSEPDLSQKVLIPAFFQKKIDSPLFDDIFDSNLEGIYLYVSNLIEIPDATKIILKTNNNKIQNYIVEKKEVIADDEQEIFSVYKLIPYGRIDIESNRDEITNEIEKENELPDDVGIKEKDFQTDVQYIPINE